jgi:hypothetical protein
MEVSRNFFMQLRHSNMVQGDMTPIYEIVFSKPQLAEVDSKSNAHCFPCQSPETDKASPVSRR